MGTLSVTSRNSALNHLGTEMTYAGLLDGSQIELTGGSPAYARKAITFSAADSGTLALASTYEFDIPSGATVAYVAYYGAISGGEALALDAVVQEVYSGQGTYTLSSGTITLT